jgi:predicted esterase
MRHRVFGVVLGAVCLAHVGCGEDLPTNSANDHRAELRYKLQALADQSDDAFLRRHFNAILQVVAAGDRGSSADDRAVEALSGAFGDASTPHSPRLRESYLDRSRPLVVSWVSPTDGQVSFAWLTLPAHWDPALKYPLYIQLHGLWDVAQDPIPYLAYPFSNPGSSYAFEDGYLISPWGRGNLWYRGIAETDIWEGISAVKALVRVNERRQYLCGHSMGGYGAWHIAHSSAGVWAALGIHAGALWFDNGEVTSSVATALRDVPTYFVVGTEDALLSVNQTAYGLLQSAGNRHLAFVTFPGGHDYRQGDVEAMYLWLRGFEQGRVGSSSAGAASPRSDTQP